MPDTLLERSRLCPPLLALAWALAGCPRNAPLAPEPPPASSQARQHDAGPPHGDAATDAPPSGATAAAKDGGTAAPTACTAEAWSSYGANAARTFATGSCCKPPLRIAHAIRPPPYLGRKAKLTHAVATDSHIYAGAVRGESPAVFAFNASGEQLWVFDSRADIAKTQWPSVIGAHVVFNDDGLYRIRRDTGAHTLHGLDTWGQTLFDGTYVVANNVWKEHGPGLMVASYDSALGYRWRQNRFVARGVLVDDIGGIAAADSTVVHAAHYRFRNQSLLGAYESGSGAPRWQEKVLPVGSPGIRHGKVYTLESPSDAEGDDVLVARDFATGKALFRVSAPGGRGQGAALLEDLVLLHGKDGLRALRPSDGSQVWHLAKERKRPNVGQGTTLAVSESSRIAVVTTDNQIHVVDTRTGALVQTVVFSDATLVHSPIVVPNGVYVVADGALVRLLCEG